MKTFNVEARLLTNGAKVTAKVLAENAMEAELAAGRKFLELGFKGDQIKITSVDD